MGLFTRTATAAPPRRASRPVIALTGRDIDQITAAVRRASSTATIDVLHGTLQVRDLMAEAIGDRLAASGYVIQHPDPYAVAVLGWRPTPGQALSVEEADERIDLLRQMRQQAIDAAHLTTPMKEA
jgi:dienelactone hydrolase